MFLRVSYFIEAKELKKQLQTKDGHFSLQGLFVVI
jgi:hypothetical protein